jgi:hypothetical protein
VLGSTLEMVSLPDDLAARVAVHPDRSR